jgi:uncharacterized membrane protein
MTMTGLSHRPVSEQGVNEARGARYPHSLKQTELLSALLAAGAGAAMMYLLDPARGRRRRRLLADKVVHVVHVARDAAETTGRDLSNHARGLKATVRRPLDDGEADDAIIRERVRAELGRVVSHPGAIEVSVDQGLVTLAGAVLTDEAESLVSCVRKVRGVSDVEDQLDRYDKPGNVPALQGESRVARRKLELQQENWTPAARLLIGVAGGLLVAWATRNRRWDSPTAAVGLTGFGLMTRAATNMPFDRLVGVGAGRRAVSLQNAINISAPVDEVFTWLTAWEQWPRWMSHVREVDVVGRDDDGRLRTRWVVDGPAGTKVSWDAITTRLVPNELIAWKTVDGSVIRHAGRIRLIPTDRGATRVDIQMSYNPVIGAAGHAVAILFRRDPKRQLDDDLARLKTTIETGTAPRDAAAGEPTAPIAEEAGLE